MAKHCSYVGTTGAKMTGRLDEIDDGAVPSGAALWGLLLCSLFPMMGLFSIGVDLPQVAETFSGQANATFLVQMMGGSTGFAFALSSPFIGFLIERFGYRNVYLVSVTAFALVGAIPVLLDSLPLIIVSRCVLGVATAGAITAGMTGLGALPAAIRPRMFGRNAVVSSIGALISFPLVGQLAQIDWRAPFFLHLLGLIVVPMARKLPAWRLEPHIVAQRQRTPERGLGAPVAIVAMAAFVGLAMYVGPMFSPFYLATIGITDPRLAALPLSAMSVGSFLMTTSYGRIHARLGTAAIFAATLGSVGTGLLIAGLSPNLLLFGIGMFTVSCGLAVFTPNLGASISASSRSPSRGIGSAMSAMFAVQAVFPFMAQQAGALLGLSGIFLCLGEFP